MRPTVLILIALLSVATFGQDPPKIGEIFDFQIGDEFHFRKLQHPYDYADRVKYIDRIDSPDQNKVTYIRHWNNYLTYPDYDEMKLVWSVKEYTDTIIISNLDSSILLYAANYEGFDPLDTNLYFWTEQGLWACSDPSFGFTGIWSPGGWDTIGGHNPSKVITYVRGLGKVWEDNYEGGGYAGVEQYKMFYYNKEDSTCGNPDTTYKAANTEKYPEKPIRVYPNPCSEVLYIVNLYPNKKVIVSIYTINGRLVYTKRVNQLNSIKVSNLSPGHYYIKITQGYKNNILIFLKE